MADGRPFAFAGLWEPWSTAAAARAGWQVALRYSYLDLTDQDIRGGVEQKCHAERVWYFNPYANLQVNAIYGDIRDREPIEGFTSGHFTALGTRLRIEF